MEGIGSEVSQKIRAAIKAKLIELGAYVDDELPDYIMVMVANKRTRSQMDEDLQLFLTSNTKIFTSWLHTVLQKLQEVTVASFENKKESESKKSKRKKSEGEDSGSRKSSEEGGEKSKKHSKKHKEMKKGKKNKHKTKEKTKSRSEKKNEKEEKSGKDEKKTSQDKTSKSKRLQLNDAVGKAILGDLKKSKRLKSDKHDSSQSSSSDESSNAEEKSAEENGKVAENNKSGGVYPDDDVLNIKVDDDPGMDIDCNKNNKKELIEDEFNIEPLKPSEKQEGVAKGDDVQETGKNTDGADMEVQVEKTISAPTEELLKEHDKLQNQKLEEKEKKTQQSDSEESLSPEEMRKQLLLSRAKKKLEESKLAERMRSNSPDVLILEDDSRLEGKQKDSSKQPERRSTRSPRSKESSCSPSRRRGPSVSYSSDRRSHLGGGSPPRRGNDQKQTGKRDEAKSNEERRKISLSKGGRNSSPDTKNVGSSGERRKNVIRISESSETDRKREKETSSRRRPVSSRVVTITGPEAPEIPSIVKVKPREYISKDKQANKALILKAVADAEKSIATVHTRNEIEAEPKKKEALFTKNLRGKRYEKLAVTLSNIRKSPDSRDRLERRVSVDSDKSDKSRPKHDSSDFSGGVRIKSDLLSKKLSKSDDQFISSKTTIMEKNDKYIRCWLEGVEKAVKDDEIVNPSEMEDFVQSNLTDEENELGDEERKRKRKAVEAPGEVSPKAPKLSDREIANLRVIPNAGVKEDGPQIVVTLDGLNSKTIKDLILRNKESGHKPLLSSAGKKDDREKISGPAESRKSGPEKISDRFARLNKVKDSEETGGNRREDKKGSKYQSGGDKEKRGEEKKTTESKNRQLIAQLSEKFGKVDREFENKKRKRTDDDRRYSYESTRRNEKEDNDRNGRYRRSERRSFREGGFGFFRRS